jgi:hypothetical protein
MPKQASLSEGYLAFGFELNASREEHLPALLTRLPLTDGILEMYALEDQIAAQLLRVTNNQNISTDLWISPHLRRNEQKQLIMTLAWENAMFTIFSLDGKEFPRGSESDTLELANDLKYDVVTDEIALDGASVPFIDRSGLNIDMLRNLRQTVERLGWSLNQLAPDRPGIALDIAAHLRMLLTGKPNGLLFIVSSSVGVDLSCYVSKASTGKDSFEKLRGLGAVAFEQVASSAPKGSQTVSIGFEEWLTWPALLRNDITTAHWEVVRMVADKVSVHADANGLEVLREFLNVHHPGVDLGVLVQIIWAYGLLTFEIASAFLLAIDRA